MSVGRVVAALTASVAVGGCAVVVFGITSAHSSPDAAARSSVAPAAPTSRPAFIPVTPSAAASTPVTTPSATRAAAPAQAVRTTAAAPRTTALAIPTTAPARTVVAAPPKPAVVVAPKPVTKAVTKPVAAAKPKAPATHVAARPKGQSLPLRYSTGSATRVITVTAHSSGSTTATLQAWTKAAGGGWLKQGAATTAHIGADGMGRASESTSKTPVGSYTLTQAFGHNSNPGTPLPYTHTTAADWWISQPGRLYNTRQHCSSGCAFTRGNPNEHLYYETPYYNYAVVIDYNTRNAPGGVRAGRGSAFFLHVTDGHPTAGCVSIPQTKLVSIMKWLAPSTHPRILIGTV